MLRCLSTTFLSLQILVLSGCGILDVSGTLSADGLDVPEQADTAGDVDGPDPSDTLPPDADVDMDPGCLSDEACSDHEPCNGEETCQEDGACHDGMPLGDGEACVTAAGNDGVCASDMCRPLGCGDGVLGSGEECDDENFINGDGCEANCTYTCHDDADCMDADPCTDESCETGGNGRICVSTFTEATCDDLDPCTRDDTCNGAGTCAGIPYACIADQCELTSACDGDGGCTVTYALPGAGCDDAAPCTSDDECNGAGMCAGTSYACTAGQCELTSACDGDGGCTVTYALPGAGCDDAAPCTSDDECNGAGMCAGTPYTCTAGPCQNAACDGSGGCTMTLWPPGTPCNDSNACTHTDLCSAAGACAGTPYSCIPGTCQLTSACDGAGGCNVTYDLPGEGCDDEDSCTYPDLCNGSGMCTGTPYTCPAGTCQVATCDGSGGCSTSQAPVGTACNDTNPCTHTDRCSSTGTCAGTPYSCVPGMCQLTSVCNGSGTCTVTYAGSGTPCNDSVACTHTDVCNGSGTCAGTPYSCVPGTCQANSECNGAGGCIVTYSGPGTPCNDSVPCTHTDVCSGGGTCAGTPYSCTPGQCELTSTCDGTGGCTRTPAGTGTACDDGFACTTPDRCDGAGHCAGTPDDSRCTPGQICRPACFPSTGCGTPPGSLVVDCPASVTNPADATCSIHLDTLAGQTPCLSCTTEVGTVTLSADTFSIGAGCTMGSWSLVSGNFCVDDVDSCNPRNVVACCATAGTIQATVNGDCRLRSERDENCGGSHDEWQIVHGFDTRGLDNLSVCFNLSENAATSNEGVLVYVVDGGHAPTQVFCLNGPPVTGDTGVDNQEWPYCASLPSWAEDNPEVLLTFIAHSNDNNQAVYLDDVVVKGMTASCAPARAVAFSEDFEPCPATNPIPSGWNGWTVVTASGSGPSCGNFCSGGTPGGARADNGTWTMSHPVDTSGLDSDVRLCFDVGDSNSDYNETIQVSFDTGSGWQTAWYWENEWGTDGSCRRVCLPLSAMDASVAGNPDLSISFRVQSNQAGEQVFINDIVLDGAVHCSGAGQASVGTITDLGSGTYSFGLSDDSDLPMGAYATCAWDTPPDPVTGSDSTWFVSP